jgi:predicted transcriptional regulator
MQFKPFRLPADQWDRLVKLKEETRVSVSALIREGIDLVIEQRRKEREALISAGLAVRQDAR